MSQSHTPAELEARLRKAIPSTRAVMLGLMGETPSHFQPMHAYLVEEERPIWFLCRRDIELVQGLAGQTLPAMINVVSEDHHLHASVKGLLREDRDQGRIDLFWSSVAEAWLPEGKTSPLVTVLRFEPEDAEIWLSDTMFKLAWEGAKANYNQTRAQSGEHANVAL
jgi:general stress protein 26